MTSRSFRPVVFGDIQFASRLFSNEWELYSISPAGPEYDEVLAVLHRIPSTHTSLVTLADGTRLELKPEGWGTVVAEGDTQKARIERQSWWGRRWETTGVGFAYELTSDPLPRRWSLRVGGHPIGHLAGTIWSYNRLDVHTDVSVPIHAVVLAWHVLARPWEAAAAPRSLRPLTPRPPSP